MKKIIKLNERDLTRIIKRVINEQGDGDSFFDSNLFHDDTESVIPQIMNILSPVYEKHGTEGVLSVLSGIIGTIDDIGDEAFMGSENY